MFFPQKYWRLCTEKVSSCITSNRRVGGEGVVLSVAVTGRSFWNDDYDVLVLRDPRFWRQCCMILKPCDAWRHVDRSVVTLAAHSKRCHIPGELTPTWGIADLLTCHHTSEYLMCHQLALYILLPSHTESYSRKFDSLSSLIYWGTHYLSYCVSNWHCISYCQAIWSHIPGNLIHYYH